MPLRRATSLGGKLGILAFTLIAIGAGSPNPVLQLTVENLRNEEGMLRLCITQDRRFFPNCKGDPHSVRRNVDAGQHAISFPLPEGDYAVSLIHDENGNGKLDTMLGIPKEGFGFSRNPAIRMGPPRYDDVIVHLGEAGSHLRLRVRYLL